MLKLPQCRDYRPVLFHCAHLSNSFHKHSRETYKDWNSRSVPLSFCYRSAVCTSICKVNYWPTGVVFLPGCNREGVCCLFVCLLKKQTNQVPRPQPNPINISRILLTKSKEHSQGIAYSAKVENHWCRCSLRCFYR